MKIVLYKLGSMEEKIIPSKEAIEKLKKVIAETPVVDGVKEIVWGPELSVEVYDIPETYKQCGSGVGIRNTSVPVQFYNNSTHPDLTIPIGT